MKLNLEPLYRFVEHMPPTENTELTLLKGHLLIEEVLTKLIERFTKNPKYLLDAKLNFAQKVYLARSLHGLDGNEWIWGALKKLNNARNKLAHGLDPELISRMLEEFTKVVESSDKQDEITRPEHLDHFSWAIFKLFFYISQHAHFDPTQTDLKLLLSEDEI
jgi:hypothetical protein